MYLHKYQLFTLLFGGCLIDWKNILVIFCLIIELVNNNMTWNLSAVTAEYNSKLTQLTNISYKYFL